MKVKYPFLIIAILTVCLFACKKDNGTNPASIVGNWNIVSDSTYEGVGINNHPVDYAGRPGDYFDIKANGIIYTKEGSVLDTLSYTLVSDSTVAIASFGLNANGVQSVSHIRNHTAYGMIIASPVALTPGGIFARKVTLSK